ncbi:hypothetical protein G4Y79_03885 [Phototrophicus methaneseepsis]|uniref:Uncharacterized protein n=1 Tax=Phototrophicus methaneseepsis TaxID=2710758 RepID=A0A7S8IFJ1_9CHLR|nr:hypothetical protein [Phototrophicus methaneseepsis]QPC83534.1 hypothetical protein G4Y79_03885 [Phototrophicus methaneseepsis]
MIDETRVIPVKEIVENPQDVRAFQRAFIMIIDSDSVYRFVKLLEAMDILALQGWELISLDIETSYALALWKNPHFKAKSIGI